LTLLTLPLCRPLSFTVPLPETALAAVKPPEPP